ncbi:Golgi integral membrane protein 4a isoform X2 [Heptranchias perlo]|uniref:Golgi integral membrane protein 4a isoform X2 n=1 Tax=Heptranchias perlo TaxID=212740 RepID=UPI0035599B4C
MGSNMCSRRQKKIFQTLFFLTIVFGFLYGLLLYYEMHNQLKKAETLALKYQQHQEALSAQLQVVYEHRSRLEKSLQKERNEHKKAKEDYLVYKLEAQESLNKEKQDSSNRYSALSVQHKMLKNQHEDLRKQYTDLHGEHQRLGEDHSRAMNEHSRRYLSLQQEKEQEIAKLKENIYNLLEENKKLRKAHQDVHVQLQDVRQLHKNLQLQHDQLQITLEDHKNSLSAAQAQVEEYKQLRETLNKMPSLRQTEQKTPPSNAQKPHQDIAEPLQYHEKLGVHDQIPYRSEDNQHNEEGVQLHIKPMIGENDDTRIREDNEGGTEKQFAQHEDWQRNEQPGHSDLEKHGYEAQEHRHEWEQDEKEDHTVQQTEIHEQHQEEEETENHLIEDRDNENDQTEEQNLARSSPTETKIKKHKSPYEEQLEQQHLAELRAEEARKLKEKQDALHQQRLKEYMDRQQRLQREAERKEELLRQEQLRQQSDFDNNDDAAEGDDEQDVHEEEEEVDDENNPHGDAEDQDPEIVNEDHHAEIESINQQKPVGEDLIPTDDPNNQGEDEFEEAEQEQEESPQDKNNPQQKMGSQLHDKHEIEDQLVIGGNPDQQEDNLDEQYQDEEEIDEKEGEANEQEEEAVADETNQKGEKEDENYEEDEEEEEEEGEVPAAKTNRRAEM